MSALVVVRGMAQLVQRQQSSVPKRRRQRLAWTGARGMPRPAHARKQLQIALKLRQRMTAQMAVRGMQTTRRARRQQWSALQRKQRMTALVAALGKMVHARSRRLPALNKLRRPNAPIPASG